ncbi:hypothetical protein C1645_829765 [Glomus cerebriforme]|uniref:Uncharacterized protein n=1 Tax=Glomus cerebriforme TaxID=658196 RepID=A0A397STA1_9GLOM|nr:hypothetical protein C1645_829765 [Glomus cerebriforme]
MDWHENLKNFEWKDDFEDDNDFIEDPYKETFLALEKKADILNHLKIFFQYIDGFENISLQEVLPKLYKLKTLIIDDYYYENQLIYKYIEILHVDYITINTASNIIENSGGQLKEILLFKYWNYYYIFDGNFNEDSLNFIRKVCDHCPLIEYLTLAFSPTKEHFTEFKKLLKVSLEEFLKKWKGRPALSIITTDHIYNGEDYIKLINEYKNDGIIKDFIVSNHVQTQ